MCFIPSLNTFPVLSTNAFLTFKGNADLKPESSTSYRDDIWTIECPPDGIDNSADRAFERGSWDRQKEGSRSAEFHSSV